MTVTSFSGDMEEEFEGLPSKQREFQEDPNKGGSVRFCPKGILGNSRWLVLVEPEDMKTSLQPFPPLSNQSY